MYVNTGNPSARFIYTTIPLSAEQTIRYPILQHFFKEQRFPLFANQLKISKPK